MSIFLAKSLYKLKDIVFATNNPHKLDEARAIVGNRFRILSLSEIGCHDYIPETAETLEGNALIKARWIKGRYGYDCFADDTGLMVDALGGRPGVYSARYAGPECDSMANVGKLLSELEGKENREAHFSTVVALLFEGGEYVFTGTVDGAIAATPRGESGFGYDSVFVPDESGVTFAEMASGAKNGISHRGRAIRSMVEFLDSIES